MLEHNKDFDGIVDRKAMLRNKAAAAGTALPQVMVNYN